MVVTRKTPLVPPPTSRTNSSQATPRTSRSKVQSLSNLHGVTVGDDLKAGSSNGSGNSNNGKGSLNDVVSEISSYVGTLSTRSSFSCAVWRTTNVYDMAAMLILIQRVPFI